MKRTGITLAFTLLVLALSACSAKIDISTLAGKYTLSGGEGLDTLELNADGTYIHGYTDYATALTTRAGPWELGDVDGAKTVTLRDYIPVRNEKTSGEGFCVFRVERSMGRLRLVTDAEPDRYYAK